MKVRYIDDMTARTDGRRGKPTEVTLDTEYVVAEVLEDKYSIINDAGKICRYSKSRFVITDNQPVVSLREAFNTLTSPMRAELKRLKKTLEEKTEND